MKPPVHPMTALKGTPEGAALMAHVRSHRKGTVAKKKPAPKPDVENAADVASEPGGEPANEKTAALAFMKRRKAAAKPK